MADDRSGILGADRAAGSVASFDLLEEVEALIIFHLFIAVGDFRGSLYSVDSGKSPVRPAVVRLMTPKSSSLFEIIRKNWVRFGQILQRRTSIFAGSHCTGDGW
jgi:hypothetical protein